MPHSPALSTLILTSLSPHGRLGHVDELETGTCRDLPKCAHGPIMPGCRRQPPAAAGAPFVVRRPPFGALWPAAHRARPPAAAGPPVPVHTAPRRSTWGRSGQHRPDTDPGGDP